jgi:hypothetical protein
VIFGFNTDVKFGGTVYHVQSEAREHDELLQTQVFVKGRCIGKHATSFHEHVVNDEIPEEKLHDLLKAQHKHFVDSARAGTIEQEITDNGHAPAKAIATAAPVAPAPVAPAPVPAPAPQEDRISISLSDDPDLAAIAEASAAAVIEETAHPVVVPMEVPDVLATPVVEAPADPILDQFMAELDAAEKEPAPPPLPQYRMEPAGSVIGKGIDLECLEPIVAPDGSGVLLNVTVAEAGVPSASAQITCRISAGSGPAAYVYATSSQEGIADLHIATQGLDATTGMLIQATVRGKSASRKFNLKRS